MHAPFAIGKRCPFCGTTTIRERTPWYVRPARWLLLNRCSWRRCPNYHWQGLALHGR